LVHLCRRQARDHGHDQGRCPGLCDPGNPHQRRWSRAHRDAAVGPECRGQSPGVCQRRSHGQDRSAGGGGPSRRLAPVGRRRLHHRPHLARGRRLQRPLKPRSHDGAPMNTADIQPVPEPYGGKILTWKTLLIGNLLTLLPLLLFVAGMVRAGMAAFEWLEDAQRPRAKPVGQVISSLVLIGLGLLSAGLAAYMVFRNTTKIANWYLKRKVRKAFRWRPDCNVDPDDPEATFVEVVPRQNWGKLMLETATDVGFLLV